MSLEIQLVKVLPNSSNVLTTSDPILSSNSFGEEMNKLDIYHRGQTKAKNTV